MSASSRQSCLLNSYRRNLGLIGGSRCRWCVTISTTYNISDSAQIMWSLVASFQAFLSGKSSFYACRALLGLIEGGFIPDNILYLSYWYTGKELPRRLSFFWTAYQFTSIVGAFLALGLLKLRGANGLAGWRWLFAIEGTITGLIGVATYFYLPPSPTQTSSFIRGRNGWFDEREEKIMVNRILRDDPSKGAASWSWAYLSDPELMLPQATCIIVKQLLRGSCGKAFSTGKCGLSS
jgi:MFS family permease